ncbi:hypothetical protein N9U60_01255 [Betaproteobacteria bacterium]|nr:hypothetical protein [Betaproteobacteria bacterium]
MTFSFIMFAEFVGKWYNPEGVKFVLPYNTNSWSEEPAVCESINAGQLNFTIVLQSQMH